MHVPEKWDCHGGTELSLKFRVKIWLHLCKRKQYQSRAVGWLLKIKKIITQNVPVFHPF